MENESDIIRYAKILYEKEQQLLYIKDVNRGFRGGCFGEDIPFESLSREDKVRYISMVRAVFEQYDKDCAAYCLQYLGIEENGK